MRTESLPEAVEKFELEKYFSRIENHGGDRAEAEKNSFYVFVDLETGLDIIDDINIDVVDLCKDGFDKILIDFSGCVYIANNGIPAYRIVIDTGSNHFIIGYFLKDKKSLLVSDLTHFPEDRGGKVGFEILRQIMAYLKTNDLIQEL